MMLTDQSNRCSFYARKLYAFLSILRKQEDKTLPLDDLKNVIPEIFAEKAWWESIGQIASCIAGGSDRVSLEDKSDEAIAQEVRHPLSGESRAIAVELPSIDWQTQILTDVWNNLCQQKGTIQDREVLLQQLFWWCWRFYPQALASKPDDLIYPAYRVLPDSTWHGHASTVSAIAGSLSVADKTGVNRPYLLLFTFSPIQEFIKASRKFLDFWAGSYLLHYLSARLCWSVALMYGPDAVITPSLWEQPIFDALLLKQFPNFQPFFGEGHDPASRFSYGKSTALCTAGFPNTITVLVPGQQAAIDLGKHLKHELKQIWTQIAKQVRQTIERRFLVEPDLEMLWNAIAEEFHSTITPNPYYRELRHYHRWEWESLWNSQTDHTWETYFATIPLGHPEELLEITKADKTTWIAAQNEVLASQHRIPSEVEQAIYDRLNVGTLWGSLQGRLGQAIQACKNTRNWEIPTAPGERSSTSGHLSVLHPRFNYAKFSEGRGVRESSNRLFWRAMAVVFPGLFNGSEKLNALEVTKRMAWKYGGVAESLGIPIEEEDYEALIRFPNLSSIAAARFAQEYPDRLRAYWAELRGSIAGHPALNRETYDRFYSITRRPFQIRQTDQAIASLPNAGNGYNGLMFSSRWLLDDLGLTGDAAKAMRQIVNETLINQHFGESSPADWWVLVLADGDSMGQYLSGRKLKAYGDYLAQPSPPAGVPAETWDHFLQKTKKRMGPSTHIGFNRALLDFANCLVPHLAEQRCCGRVIYSGGDDVMVALPLSDLPRFLRSQRAAWCGDTDPEHKFQSGGGYWLPPADISDLPARPLFTMGQGATMSLGIVIAHQRVPLPTVLETLWSAEKDRAKALLGEDSPNSEAASGKARETIPDKDGICFRVIYGSGNVSEALMKGHLLELWWAALADWETVALEPLLLRLAEDIAAYGAVTASDQLMAKIAGVVFSRREKDIPEHTQSALWNWLNAWEDWAWKAQSTAHRRQMQPLGATPDDLANLLRFSAFWVARQRQTLSWVNEGTRT